MRIEAEGKNTGSQLVGAAITEAGQRFSSTCLWLVAVPSLQNSDRSKEYQSSDENSQNH
jgi:hypothetical protein